ncbi:MAG: histidinol dehydrogenase [Sphaerochaetaceae bacterium]
MGRIKRIINPELNAISSLLARPSSDSKSVETAVSAIIARVISEGDAALLAYTQKFDHVSLASLIVSSEVIAEAQKGLAATLRAAIDHAKQNIYKFHWSQKPRDEQVETQPGVYCWRKSIPIEKVGIYVPGGSAPLFSTVLMLAVPAQIAGCKEIILTTPPRHDGSVDPAILYAASISGVTKVITVGGAQAIAALAYGTESIPAVDKIFGPGNRFVTEAKQQVATHQCAIDLPAGPSEVMVVIDATSNAAFAAADLLSQAEHGPDSQVVLVVEASDEATGHAIVDAVESHIAMQITHLSRHEIIRASLEHSKAVIITKKELTAAVINSYAPEHLIINTANLVELATKIQHAGSVFLGQWSCESVGDYASGTNHTLPTAGWARSYSGVSLDSFYKKITFQRITCQGLKAIGPIVEVLASGESLEAHSEAVSVRLKSLRRSDECL